MTESGNKPKARILVVDDDERLCESLVYLFEAEGFEVRTAHDAAMAFDLAGRETPDLIVADVRMPGGDGIDLLARLRSQPELAGMPVIFLSGRTDPDLVRRGMNTGADDYLTKPFDPAQLVAAVRARLQRRAEIDARLAVFRRTMAHSLPHSLRSSLAGVIGFAEILHQDAIEAGPGGTLAASAVRESSGFVLQSARRLLEVIERSVLWVELSTRADELRAQRAHWADLAGLAGLEHLARERAVQARREADLSLELVPAVLAVPVGYFAMVAVQLIDNAFRFSRTGQRVIVKGAPEGGNYVLTVQDEGRGIAVEKLARIEAAGGSAPGLAEDRTVGVGLAIVQRFVSLVGGRVRLHSNPLGGDTRVTLELPLVGEPGSRPSE